jgi:ADP-dependent NAD(P)H-hydrate dehydratase
VTRRPRATKITRALLRRIPLPTPDEHGDKDARGRVLAVGGSIQTPGAILLAGVAALRAGAGKLQLATVRSAAATLGVAVPESLVVALPETRAGEIAGDSGGRTLAERTSQVDALLLGSGMSSDRGAHALIRALAHRLGENAVLVLDAAAVTALRGDDHLLRTLQGRAVLTPHAGEMATLLDAEKEDIEANPASRALEAAARFGAVVALKGPESWIAEPGGALYQYVGGSVGLATSGSGDTLAGIVAGLAARGASPTHAAVWGAYLHGEAGEVLARRIGPIGYLARELLDEVPGLMRKFSGTA